MSAALMLVPPRSTRRARRTICQTAPRQPIPGVIIEAILRYEDALARHAAYDLAWIANPTDRVLERCEGRANDTLCKYRRKLERLLVKHDQPVELHGTIYKVEPWTEFEGDPLGLVTDRV
jgi:hypothetical protein